MLLYLGRGERQYGLKPFPIEGRRCWEFEAVIRGRIAPTFDSTVTPAYAESTLWTFAPGVRHGWTGDGAHSSEVLVFHFHAVPEPLASVAGGATQVSIDKREIARMSAIATEIEGELSNPTLKGNLLVSRAIAELSLIALKNVPDRPLLDGHARDKAVVHAATTWINQNLADGPTLEAAAEAIRVSPSHLRRLFHRVCKQSPRAVIAELRFARARALLRNARLTLEAIAGACGYSDASALSRAFRKHCGKPPSAFRKE